MVVALDRYTFSLDLGVTQFNTRVSSRKEFLVGKYSHLVWRHSEIALRAVVSMVRVFFWNGSRKYSTTPFSMFDSFEIFCYCKTCTHHFHTGVTCRIIDNGSTLQRNRCCPGLRAVDSITTMSLCRSLVNMQWIPTNSFDVPSACGICVQHLNS